MVPTPPTTTARTVAWFISTKMEIVVVKKKVFMNITIY